MHACYESVHLLLAECNPKPYLPFTRLVVAKFQFTDIKSQLCVWSTVALFYFLSDTVARFITAAADDAQPFFPPESLVSTPIPPLCDVSPAMRECVLYSTTFAKRISLPPRN